MDILDPRIEEYVERLTTPHDALLAELSEETARSLGAEQMLTGPVAGRFLELLVWGTRPKRVLEIGTFSGHSALAMGPALETIASLDGEFDLVFIDADKEGYVDYYEAVLPRLAERGLMVADNTLWSGGVLDGEGPIVRFNDHVAADPRTVQVILSVRDGMTLIRRA